MQTCILSPLWHGQITFFVLMKNVRKERLLQAGWAMEWKSWRNKGWWKSNIRDIRALHVPFMYFLLIWFILLSRNSCFVRQATVMLQCHLCCAVLCYSHYLFKYAYVCMLLFFLFLSSKMSVIYSIVKETANIWRWGEWVDIFIPLICGVSGRLLYRVR